MQTTASLDNWRGARARSQGKLAASARSDNTSATLAAVT